MILGDKESRKSYFQAEIYYLGAESRETTA